MRIRLHLITLTAFGVLLATAVVAAPAQAATLAAPTNMVAVQQDGYSIALSWDLPPDDPTNPRQSLELAISVNGAPFVPDLRRLAPNATSWVDPEGDYWLTAGSTYEYRITAVGYNGHSDGAVSQPVTFSVVADAPQNVVGTAANDGSVTLSWSAPANDGGTPITSYAIYRSYAYDSSPREYHRVASVPADGPLTFIDTTTTAFTSEAYYVVGVNKWGGGIRPQTDTVVVPWLAANTLKAATYTLLPGGWVTLTSTPGALRLYEHPGLLVSEPSTKKTTSVFWASQATFHYSPGSRHVIDVFGWNGWGQSPKAIRLAFTAGDLPGAPRSLHAVARSGRVTVTWAPPKSTGYVAIKSYRITSASTGAVKVVKASTRSVVFSGLQPKVWHTFTVSAINAVGTSKSVSVVSR